MNFRGKIGSLTILSDDNGVAISSGALGVKEHLTGANAFDAVQAIAGYSDKVISEHQAENVLSAFLAPVKGPAFNDTSFPAILGSADAMLGWRPGDGTLSARAAELDADWDESGPGDCCNCQHEDDEDYDGGRRSDAEGRL